MRWMTWAILRTGVSGEPPVGQPSLLGSWKPEDYTMKDGTRHPVDGLIFFSERDWSVVFFVLAEGKPSRGAAEAGTYTADGSRLVFTHLYHLSSGRAVAGLPETPLQMEVRSSPTARVEPCTYRIDGDRLRIDFPSGSTMTFRGGGSGSQKMEAR